MSAPSTGPTSLEPDCCVHEQQRAVLPGTTAAVEYSMAHRKKRSVSFDPELDRRVGAAAAAEGLTVSAWLARCAHDKLLNEDGLRAMAEYQRLFGEFSSEEMAAAEAESEAALELARAAHGALHAGARRVSGEV